MQLYLYIRRYTFTIVKSLIKINDKRNLFYITIKMKYTNKMNSQKKKKKY